LINCIYIFPSVSYTMSNEDEYEGEGEEQGRSTKEVLIRNSDMQPEEECAVVSVANSAIEEVADMQGIF
jgi:hypothetical protein